MSGALDSLARTPGVVACAVFDSDGQCVEARTEPPFEAALLALALRQIHEVFAVASGTCDGVTSQVVTDFYAEGAEGWLSCRRVGGFDVLAVGTGAVNAPALKVAFNVTELRVRECYWGRPPVAASPRALDSQPGHVVEGAIDDSVLDAVVARLHAHLGPAAKAVLGREMRRLGLTTTTLTPQSYSALIARLCERIPQSDRQRDFERRAAALIRHLPRGQA